MRGLSIERGGRAVELCSVAATDAALFAGPLRVGVVIGTFAAVPYIHLHLEAWRRLYPHAALLVHDDASPHAGRLAELCAEYGAEFERNTERCPPCKGDLTAFVGGLLWARERGLDLLVKLSRRFVPLTDWTASLSELALDSHYATYCAWTTTFNFGFRSECVGLAVAEWFRLNLVAELASRVLAPGEPFVEGFVHDLARRAAGLNHRRAREYDARIGARPADRNGYAVWPWMGTDRCARNDRFLWHDAATPADYHALGKRWGLRYDVGEFRDPNGGFGARGEDSGVKDSGVSL